ncbi:MAG: hypothetical protein LBO00_08215, partial [Zoogloeaceae bacterium]|nr:hypothetical protein [Zoogloeaceae bacterium]
QDRNKSCFASGEIRRKCDSGQIKWNLLVQNWYTLAQGNPQSQKREALKIAGLRGKRIAGWQQCPDAAAEWQ